MQLHEETPDLSGDFKLKGAETRKGAGVRLDLRDFVVSWESSSCKLLKLGNSCPCIFKLINFICIVSALIGKIP